MTSEQFAYWLQGFTELNAGTMPTPAQWKSITEHLNLVFKKITPAVQQGPIVMQGAEPKGRSITEIITEMQNWSAFGPVCMPQIC